MQSSQREKGALRDFAAQPELGNENRASGERFLKLIEKRFLPSGVIARQARLDASRRLTYLTMPMRGYVKTIVTTQVRLDL